MPLDSLTNGPYLGTTRNPFSYEKIEQVSRDLQTEWLTLDEITQQLNLFQDESQDTYLQSLELATRFAIEDYLGMSIFPITWKVYYGATNGMTGTQSAFDLPEVSQANQNTAGVVINSVSYYTGGNPPVLTVLDKSLYFYDPTGNKVLVSSIPNDISEWMTNPVIVTYTTNPSPIAQYPVIKQAALLLLTHLYNNRSNSFQGALNNIPFGVDQLLRAYKPLVM
jgi:hypothetical protein